MNCLIQRGEQWFRLCDPVRLFVAYTPAEVACCLEQIDVPGLWAAGWVAYEAARACDDALQTHCSASLPLLQFGLFRRAEPVALRARGSYSLGSWTPSVTRGEYAAAIAEIKTRIAAGQTYQVNYTFRMEADFHGDAHAFLCDLMAAQRGGRYGAFIQTDELAICSASPELFFERREGLVVTRPMKGTRPRGLSASADQQLAAELAHSTKDRAENIMIVDMLRNDLGRIAEVGSVQTPRVFDVERYPTVLQMTSTVTARTTAPFAQIWKSLFPCASITGAPKAKTMQIIRALEPDPRGLYTGSVGWIAPNGDAQFNVAIRTAVIQNQRAQYGVGGGIVWDSEEGAEYDEAFSKAAILTKPMPSFELLETMLFENGALFLLERHWARLRASAQFFGIAADWVALRAQLMKLEETGPTRVRVRVSRAGAFAIETRSHARSARPMRVALARDPVDARDPFLYHKTTHRALYERARAAHPAADDVLLYNERGELTESCLGNLVVSRAGRRVTPPVHCGLLAGTFRAELLARGEVEEAIVHLDDLPNADAIWVVNSVRKWCPVRWIDSPRARR